MTNIQFDHKPQANFLNIVIGSYQGDTARAISAKWPDYHWLIVETEEQVEAAYEQLADYQLEHTSICGIDEITKFIEANYPTVLFNRSWVLLACDNMSANYQELHWRADTAISSCAMNAVTQHKIRTHVEIGLKNLAENNLPASHFTKRLNDKDVLICAGGPSLDSQLSWIKANQNKLVIISISRVAGWLNRNGISPDFIVLCDPFDYNFDVSAEMFDIETPSVLLYAWHACHHLVGNWIGPKAYMGRRIPDVLENNIMATAPTVTNAALNFALNGQTRQIFLSGIDMCLTVDGQSHCDGNMETTVPAYIKQDDLKVKTMQGRQAFARPYMVIAANAIGKQISESKENTPVYNLNPDALAIEGVNLIDPDDISLTGLPFNVDEVVNDINHSEVISLETRKQELLQFEYRISTIKKLARDALSKAKKIPNDDFKKERLCARLSSAAGKIKELELTRHILTRSFGEDFNAALRGTDQSEMSVDEALDRIVSIHRGYYKSCRAIEKMCVAAHERLALKEKELTGAAGQQEALRWIEIGIARRGETVSDPAIRELCVKAFDKFRKEARAFRLNLFNTHGQKAPEVMTQAKLAYEENDTDRLLIFLKLSETQFDGTVRTQFIHWIQAMLYELQGYQEKAILSYLVVVETSLEGLAESALLSLLQLTIRTGKYDDAINAVHLLVDLNPEHQHLLERTERLLTQAA